MAYKACLALALLAGIASAAPPLARSPPIFTPDLEQRSGDLEERCVGYGYATFYDDNACQDNPGQAVSIGNSGCLANEYGRNSVYIQGWCETGGNGNPSMVWSPGSDCNCQNDCSAVPDYSGNGNGCWNLNGHAGASSFRFIEQGCGPNNC